MSSTIKFGTDGWRGVIADDFTYDNVRICAQGVANYLRSIKRGSRGIVIGYDNRFASEGFAAAAAEVIAANGIKVYLNSKAAPTPVISYAVLAEKAAGAIIITASHNPAIWNGFKYKSEYAGSASPEIVAKLENQIQRVAWAPKMKRISISEGLKRGAIEYYDPEPKYLNHLSKLVDIERIRQADLKIVVDPMYGSGSGYIKGLLKGGKIKVVEINAERNPIFPDIHRPEPVAENLLKLSSKVRRLKADAGLASDGDADRVGLLDESGEFITPLQLFALLALYLLEEKKERGALVKSVATTDMIYRLGEIFSVPVLETPVGFKYIAPLMIKENALIGGEESSGFGFRGHIPERDGILSGLYLIDFFIRTGRKPSDAVKYLYDKVGPHYYKRIDIQFQTKNRKKVMRRFSELKPIHIAQQEVTGIDTLDGFRYRLDDGSWLLIRFSGTEPLIRIYAESHSMEKVESILAEAEQLGKI